MMMTRMLFSLNLMPQQELGIETFAIAFVPEESILYVGGVCRGNHTTSSAIWN